MNFTKILENVPDYKTFLTVDEMDDSSLKLKEEYPDLVDLNIIGYSRQNHPIYCLKIGTGSKKAIMFGCPHPNEPMGAMMLEYFSRALCENEGFRKEADFTWYMIKSIDPDGTKLNEGWFKGPFNLTNYAKNFFRPTGTEQVEWTFPVEYKDLKFDKTIPETSALCKLIDEVKPDFLYSLHNAGFGGAYWYISHDLPELWDHFYNAATSRGVPLSLGEPEAPYITQFAPAVFLNGGICEEYDYLEKFADPGEDIAARIEVGTSSGEYVMKYGTYSLLAELPYFYSDKISSEKTMDFTRKEAMIQGAKIDLEERDAIAENYALYKEYVSDDNPFAKMIEMMTKDRQASYQETLRYIDSDEAFLALCKESEYFDNCEVSKFYSLLEWGLLVRGAKFEYEKASVEQKAILEDLISKFETLFYEKAGYVEAMEYSLIPIQTLIRIQLESGLLLCKYINEKQK